MEARNATPRSAARAGARAISKKLINFCKYRIANRRPDESAVEQPRATAFGELLHADLFEMAAAYLFHIVKNLDQILASTPVPVEMLDQMLSALIAARARPGSGPRC